MTYLLRGAAIMVALTIAAPVWAQCSVTAENDLNRQELNRLATTSAAPVAAAPMGYAPGEARPAAYYYPYYANPYPYYDARERTLRYADREVPLEPYQRPAAPQAYPQQPYYYSCP
jgi:hypothetical protein